MKGFTTIDLTGKTWNDLGYLKIWIELSFHPESCVVLDFRDALELVEIEIDTKVVTIKPAPQEIIDFEWDYTPFIGGTLDEFRRKALKNLFIKYNIKYVHTLDEGVLRVR